VIKDPLGLKYYRFEEEEFALLEMMDGASTNRSLTKILCSGSPRVNHFQTKNIYDPQHSISIVQDIKHVFKKIRNGVESSRLSHKSAAGRCLVYDDKDIVWDHWEGAYRFNMQDGLKIHTKLTKEHIEIDASAKMRNALATDVLDRQMLYLMKEYQKKVLDPTSLDSTVEFLTHTSNLVSIFLDRNRPVRLMTDPRLQVIAKALEFFNNWEDQIISSSLYTPKKQLLTAETRDDLNSSLEMNTIDG